MKFSIQESGLVSLKQSTHSCCGQGRNVKVLMREVTVNEFSSKVGSLYQIILFPFLKNKTKQNKSDYIKCPFLSQGTEG